VDADGAILLTGDVAEAPHQSGVADGGEAKRLGPLREPVGLVARAGHVPEVVARVRADRDGNAEPTALGDRLESVVLGGK